MSTSGVRAGGCSSLALVTHGEGPIGIQSFCLAGAAENAAAGAAVSAAPPASAAENAEAGDAATNTASTAECDMWQAMSFDVIQEKRRVRRAGAAEIAAPPAGAAENAAFLAAIDAAIDAAEISEDDSDEDTQQDATDNAGSQDPALAAAAPTGAAQGAAGPTGATQHATESDEETQCEWCGSVEEIFRAASKLVLCQECDDDSWGWQKHDFKEQAAGMNAAAVNPSDSIEAECNGWGSIEETFRDWDSADVERLIRFFGRDKAVAHQFWHRYERQIRRML